MDQRERDRRPTAKDDQPQGDNARPAPVRLDLERLDLTVDEVEERIRPGETNVFDK